MAKNWKSWENRTNIDIILTFLAKPVDKHGTTLVHITYPPLKYTVLHSISSWSESTILSSQYWTEVGMAMAFSSNLLYIALQDRWMTLNFEFDSV